MAFICVKNASRSQMAEAFARRLAGDIIEPFSGGVNPAERVDPGTIETMNEIGIDLSGATPKQLSNETLASLDLIVHMGCGAPGGCLTVPGVPSEEWGIEDPVHQSKQKYREVRNAIESKVRNLRDRLRSGESPSQSSRTLNFRLQS